MVFNLLFQKKIPNNPKNVEKKKRSWNNNKKHQKHHQIGQKQPAK